MKKEKIDQKISRISLIASGSVFLILFILYSLMLSKEYSAANFGTDGGDLLGAILTDGVPHPSGYPAYLLVGRVFQFLPIDFPYYKGSLVSALFSAMAAGLVVIYSELTLRTEVYKSSNTIISFSIAIALGISPLFWSQAVIVEVYGMSMFFFVCCLLWCAVAINPRKDIQKEWVFLILSILIGFGCGTHLLLGLMLPAIGFSVIEGSRKQGSINVYFKYLLIIFLTTGIVYLVLPLRAAGNPPINWGDPRDLEGLFWLVSGKLYQGLAFRLPPEDILPRIRSLIASILEQFWFLGFLLGLFGLFKHLSSNNKIKWIHLWILTIYPFFSIGYLTNDSVIYLIPVFIVFAVLIGIGIKSLAENLLRRWKFNIAIISLIFLVPLAIRSPEIWKQVDPRRETTAKSFAENCLENAPNSAIIFTTGDADTFPLWYYHFGLDQREDLRILVTPLMNYEWYWETISETYPDVVLPEMMSNDWEENISELNQNRPICSTSTEADDDRIYCKCTEN